jgi:FkbM family methyltransferase
MTFTSYAQNFEDVMLWRALRHVKTGCYVDIGANDPVVDSVSRAFYEQGWRGVHVEPSAQYATLLRENRPDEIIIQAAVSQHQTLLTFYEFPDTGLSTLSKAIADEHQARGFKLVQNVTPTLTLDDVFSQLTVDEVHWLKIDVEGAEQDVLMGWRTSPIRPWIIVVESTLPMSQIPSHQHWESLVLEKGYQCVYFDGLNRYYVSDLHPELSAEPWLPPNVFDGFSVDGRASNVFCQDFQRRLHVAEEKGLQSANATLQEQEQTKQTLLNQLAQTRAQLEHDAAKAREEYNVLSSQVREARDELGLMVRLVSQREQEFAQRFEHFQSDYKSVSALLQLEREQSGLQLQALHQQLLVQQQQHQTELQRQRELDEQLNKLHQTLRQKEEAFASQLLQLHQQKSGQQKVFQLREQSLRTELQRAHTEIQRLAEQYHAELAVLRQTNETLRSENSHWQQLYLQLQQETSKQIAELASALQQTKDGTTTQLIQHSAELQNTINELNSAREFVEQSQRQIAELSTEREQLRHELARVAKGYVELRADFKEKAARSKKFIRALDTKHNFLLITSQQQLAEEQTKVATLNEKLQERIRIFSDLENFVKDQNIKYENTVNSLVTELDASQKAFTDYTLESSHKIQRSDELIKNLENQVVDVKNALAEASALNAQLNESVAHKEQENNTDKAKLEEIETRLFFTIQEYTDKIALLEKNIYEQKILLSECKSLLKLFYSDIRVNRTGIIYRIIQLLMKIKILRRLIKKSNLPSDYHHKYFNLDSRLNKQDLLNYLDVDMQSKDGENVQTSIDAIIQLPADEFVEMIYVNLLGRPADEMGKKHYLNKVMSGFSRTRIIYSIIKSTEWKESRRSINGLDRVIREERIKSIPLFGSLFSFIFGWQRNSNLEMQIRIATNKIDNVALSFTREICALRNEIRDSINEIEVKVKNIKSSEASSEIEDDNVGKDCLDVWSPSNFNYSEETIKKYDELLELVGVEGLKS